MEAVKQEEFYFIYFFFCRTFLYNSTGNGLRNHSGYVLLAAAAASGNIKNERRSVFKLETVFARPRTRARSVRAYVLSSNTSTAWQVQPTTAGTMENRNRSDGDLVGAVTGRVTRASAGVSDA